MHNTVVHTMDKLLLLQKLKFSFFSPFLLLFIILSCPYITILLKEERRTHQTYPSDSTFVLEGARSFQGCGTCRLADPPPFPPAQGWPSTNLSWVEPWQFCPLPRSCPASWLASRSTCPPEVYILGCRLSSSVKRRT